MINHKKNRELGRRRNQLMRYRLIMQEFDQHDCSEIPISVIYRKYIYPRYGISIQTLYKIFKIDLNKELTSVNEQISVL